MTITSPAPVSKQPRAFNGESLRHLRVGKRLSADALARHLGVTRRTVQSWEDGLAEPRFGQVVRVAEFFGLSTDYFDKSKRT